MGLQRDNGDPPTPDAPGLVRVTWLKLRTVVRGQIAPDPLRLLVDITRGGGVVIETPAIPGGSDIAMRSLLQYDGDHVLWVNSQFGDEEAIRHRHFESLKQTISAIKDAQRYLERVIREIGFCLFTGIVFLGEYYSLHNLDLLIKFVPWPQDMLPLYVTIVKLAIVVILGIVGGALFPWAMRILFPKFIPWLLMKIRPHLASLDEYKKILRST